MLYEAETWVAIAFVIFVAVLFRLGVHRTLIGSLDSRTARIQAELDEARRLREEAMAILAQYQRKRHQAEEEAQTIILNAKAEGERLATEARAKVDEFVARRTRMAEIKIAQAEAQALAEVRGAAADAAAAAAEKILVTSSKGQVADDLIAQGIRELKSKLN
jgi:F-type H+-transporting ATPase subunit b